MATCEKCWGDAYMKSIGSGIGQTEEYHKLIKENSCTPKEQCGEMHLVLEFKNGEEKCRCGKVIKINN